ncbi:hypothetical protein BO70DRAFT_256324, partial [Aspergillus heteromorphus CBS 117.55]
YVVVRFTARGNEVLRQLCHTDVQKEVWRFPSYEFIIRNGSLSVAQVRTWRPSYVNAILIASRGVRQPAPCNNITHSVFFKNIRLPGFWDGCCAGCKWKDHGARCAYASKGEVKYQPASIAALPRAIIEKLKD